MKQIKLYATIITLIFACSINILCANELRAGAGVNLEFNEEDYALSEDIAIYLRGGREQEQPLVEYISYKMDLSSEQSRLLMPRTIDELIMDAQAKVRQDTFDDVEMQSVILFETKLRDEQKNLWEKIKNIIQQFIIAEEKIEVPENNDLIISNEYENMYYKQKLTNQKLETAVKENNAEQDAEIRYDDSAAKGSSNASNEE